jgi:hypothetical protein
MTGNEHSSHCLLLLAGGWNQFIVWPRAMLNSGQFFFCDGWVRMRWPWTTRKNLLATEAAWREALDCAYKAIDLVRHVQKQYDDLYQKNRQTIDAAEHEHLRRELELSNIRYRQLATCYHQLQMRKDRPDA